MGIALDDAAQYPRCADNATAAWQHRAEIESIVHFPTGPELRRIRDVYFILYPGRPRWPGVARHHPRARVRPTWMARSAGPAVDGARPMGDGGIVGAAAVADAVVLAAAFVLLGVAIVANGR